jgi:hypothetical protein
MLVTPRRQGKLDGILRPQNRRMSRAAAARYACKGLWVPGASGGYWPTADQTLPHVLDLAGYNQHLFTKWGATNNPVPTVNPSGIAVQHTSAANSFLTGLFREFLPFNAAALYLPCTLLCVTRPTSNPGSIQFIFGIFTPNDPSVPSASPKFTVYRQGTTFTSELRHASGSSQGMSSTGWSSNATYAIAATTRTRTDHEIVVCNLDTGAISYTTNTTDSGQAARNPTDVTLGTYYYGTPPYVYSNLYDGETNLCAFMARGLSREELTALVRSPFDLVETSPSRSIASIYSPPTAITADLAATESADTLASVVTVEVSATLAATEGADSLASTVTVPNTGELAVTEAADTLVATTTVDVSATLAETEAADVLASTVQVGAGVIGALGDLAIAEGDDTLAATAELDLYADLDEAEAADTLAAFVTAGTNGPFTRRPFLVLN